jgi:asparagine synthase (glutamine-hydrolysing)
LFHQAAVTYEQERAVDSLSFVAFKQVPWHHYSRLSIEQSQLIVRSPYLDNDLVALAYRAPDSQRKSAEPALRTIAKGSPALARIPTDRGLLLNPRPTLTRILRAWREGTVRAEYAYDYGMPQWLAKIDGALKPMHLERLFLGRHKFYHFRVWYRDQLAPFVREVLLDPRSLARPYLRPVVVENMVQEHLSGRGNYTLAIHKLLTAEFIHRQLIDGAAALSRSNVFNPPELVSC